MIITILLLIILWLGVAYLRACWALVQIRRVVEETRQALTEAKERRG